MSAWWSGVFFYVLSSCGWVLIGYMLGERSGRRRFENWRRVNEDLDMQKQQAGARMSEPHIRAKMPPGFQLYGAESVLVTAEGIKERMERQVRDGSLHSGVPGDGE